MLNYQRVTGKSCELLPGVESDCRIYNCRNPSVRQGSMKLKNKEDDFLW